MEFAKVTILTGYFGSGKTELAVNLGLKLQELGPTALIDLDVVNPYFRSRKVKDILEQNGVSVIFPGERLAQADLPVVSPAVIGALNDENKSIVIDVGGDEQGAIALAQFSKHLKNRDVEVLFVINPYRPFTGSSEGVEKVIQAIERVSRQKISALVSNPNLGRETKPEEILAGHKIVEGFSQSLRLPIKFIGVRNDLVDMLLKQELSTPIVGIDIRMLVPWEI